MKVVLALVFSFFCQISIAQTSGKYWYFKVDYLHDTTIYRSELSHFYVFGDSIEKNNLSIDYLPYTSDTVVENDTFQISHEMVIVSTRKVNKDNLLFRKNNKVYISYNGLAYDLLKVLKDTIPNSNRWHYLYYEGDSIINIDKNIFDVYVIKKFESGMHLKGRWETLYIDKNTLLPVFGKIHSISRFGDLQITYSFYKPTDAIIPIKEPEDIVLYDGAHLNWEPWQIQALYTDMKKYGGTKEQCDCFLSKVNGYYTFHDYKYMPDINVRQAIAKCFE